MHAPAVLCPQAQYFASGRQRQQAVHEQACAVVVADRSVALGVLHRGEIECGGVLYEKRDRLRPGDRECVLEMRLHQLLACHPLTV